MISIPYNSGMSRSDAGCASSCGRKVFLALRNCLSEAEKENVMAAPTELRVSKDRRLLTVTFPGANVYHLSAEMLRVLSPSAEVQGHSPEQRVTVPGKRDVAIRDIVPTGNYAARIVFDDGHETGIFTWTYLEELGREKEARWQAYLDEIEAKGLSREPRR